MTHSIRLALAEDSGNEHAESSENWVCAEPFGENPMLRLTVGTIGTGKTVSAMATASRVLDTVPDARVVVFNPIPGEYDSLAHTLSEKNRDSETGNLPSATRFRIADGDALSVSASDLPAVSIVEPESTGQPECRETLSKAVAEFCSELSEAEQQWPTYLIVDETHQIFRSDSGVGFDEVVAAQQEHGALAVQVITQAFNDLPLPLEEAIEHVEGADRPVHLFDTFDLYYSSLPTQRKRFGLSSKDAEFLRGEAAPGFAGGDDVQRVPPTGLCQTPDGDWQRVRYPLTDHEAETLLERRNSRHQRQHDTATEAGDV